MTTKKNKKYPPIDPMLIKEGFFKNAKDYHEFWEKEIPKLKKSKLAREVLGIKPEKRTFLSGTSKVTAKKKK